MKKVAISVGDLNGIGIEIALRSHDQIKELITPLYLIDRVMLEQSAHLLGLDIPHDFEILSPQSHPFTLTPSCVSGESGRYSFDSFRRAIELAIEGSVDGILTLPIHKKAWEEAGVSYKGHTDALRDILGHEAIMMLGCKELFVALYTEHIPLRDVAKRLSAEGLSRFLRVFYRSVTPTTKVGVLGLNPHAGDDGVLGDEELMITGAIERVNRELGAEVYEGPLVPDIAFTPRMRGRYTHLVAMYHDQGLAPLKALYFDESINVSLGLPILRVSVDHGTAFDIAYKGMNPNNLSYLNAVGYIVES